MEWRPASVWKGELYDISVVGIVLLVRVSADTSTMFTTHRVTFTIVSLDYASIALNIADYKSKND